MTAQKLTLFLFDADTLQPGDVVLEAGSGWQSHAIRWAEWGSYSHALIWLGDGDFLEAVDEGARVVTVKRVIVERPEHWAVLRVLDDSGAGVRAAQAARQLVHIKYDLPGALGTKLKFFRHDNRTRLFCSQLVAEAYQRAGVKLVDGLEPNLITPKTLHTGSKLKAVDHAFIELGDYDEPSADRDVSYKKTVTYRDLEISQNAVDAAVPHLPERVARPANLLELYESLGKLTEAEAKPVSDALMRVFSETGYFSLIEDTEQGQIDWYERAMAALPGQSDEDRAELAKECEAMARAFKSAASRHAQLAEPYSIAFSKVPLPIWQALAECHQRRSEIFAKLDALANRALAAARA